MSRTTIQLDEELLQHAKATAAAGGRSLNDLIVDAIRIAVDARPSGSQVLELPTYNGRGLQPGVDLDNSVGLLRLME